ncbi:MAG: double-strand break repair helicase AddA [Alphaproteobacteria bacterium]
MTAAGFVDIRVRQRSASDPTASVWVGASAGTGKTHVLTDRVLRLLLEGTPPAKLLCLTFTKAAAAEMANRIHEKLGEWTTMPAATLRETLVDLAGHDDWAGRFDAARRLFARTLETPGGLKVQTIHAFCEALLRRFPIEARLPPHFEVMDERLAAERLAEARAKALAETDAGTLDTLTELVGENGFGELLADLVTQRGRLARLLARGDVDAATAALRRHLNVPDATPADLLAAGCTEEVFERDTLRAAAAALLDGAKTDKARGAAIAAWLEIPDAAARLAGLDAYAKCFLTAKSQPLKSLRTKGVDDAHEVPLRAEADRLFALYQAIKGATLVAGTAALLRFGARLVELYEEEKLAAARLDYDDLILRARTLLERPGSAAWVLYKLDGGLDHVLIDEAQDTNPDQWQVVRALSHEFFAGEGARGTHRTIFAVGDPKQSIYSFQRADPAAFAQNREHFRELVAGAEAVFRPIPLDMSFRSTEPILRLVDDLFADPAIAAGVHDGPAELHHLLHRRGDAGLVELWPLEEKPEVEDEPPWTLPLVQQRAEPPQTRLAERMAATIKGWLDGGEMLESAGRPVRAGDILILLQRRQPFLPEVLRALKTRNIPVAGADRMVLTAQTAIRDLMALARFILHVDDDLSLAEVLKGPLIGLDDDALFDLAHGRTRSLWAEVIAHGGEARERLARWIELAGRHPPFDFFARLLDAEGGRRMLIGRLGPDADDPLDEFLSLALAFEQAHTPSLQHFMHWLQAAPTEAKRDQEQRRDEIRIMTVHGAKGLQAPIVFLPDTTRAPDGPNPPRLHWLGDDALLWLPRAELANDAAAKAADAAKARRAEEHRRLLYVALTRPSDRLYIAGWQTRDAEKGERDGNWYDMLANLMREKGDEIALPDDRTGWRLSCGQAKAVKAGTTDERVDPAPPPAWIDAPPPAATRQALRPSHAGETEPPVRQPLEDAAGWRFRRGNLIHKLLELLPDLVPDRRSEVAVRLLAKWAGDVDETVRQELADSALALVNDIRFNALFGPDSLAEAPLTGRIGDVEVNGQVDRLCISDDEIWVVDYKTHRTPPARVEDVPPIYVRQMALYRALLRRIYSDKLVICALLWTETPRMMMLPADLLDAAGP